MSRIFNRPMFKRGGSAGEGITSGLNRPGYALGDSVDSVDIDEVIRLKEKMKPLYGEPPRGYNVNDFLIDWGLQMASATPQGNIVSTGAAAARAPFEKLTKGKGDAEMAEYLSDVKATDQALGAVTDIAVARAKNTLNKDFSVKRRVDTLSTQIRDKANPGTFGSTIQGSMGLALGQVYITDLIQEQGANVNVGIIANENEEGDFSFDAGNLDIEKIWWDPKQQSWLVVTGSVNDEGVEVAKKNYFTTYNEADKFHTQKKTIDSLDKKKTPTIPKENKKLTTADINQEQDEYVYKEEDFQVKSNPDAVEEAIKKAESDSTEDYDNITNFWKWVASEKDLNNYFKIKEKKIAKAPPGYN